jgi:L-2,4-diaminobutyrate decarboxylase
LFCVVATAGTTSTGSVDPILAIAELCEPTGAWLHVDGAYGLAYSLVPAWRPLFDGLERADSAVWDPHKQFRVPIPSSVLFVRQRDEFGRMALYSDYFHREEDVEPNPGLKSIASTRPFSALPLVASLRHQGLAQVRETLRAPLVAIRTLAEHIRGQPDLELGHQPDTGILCFRFAPQGIPEEALCRRQRYVYDRMLAMGQRTISMTKLDRKIFLRLVAISPAVSAEALIETVSVARALASEYEE